jgi:hypothetical protein
MARALTAKQRWALIRAFGSLDNAIDEALRRSAELRELWDTQYTTAWWPDTGAFWEAFWEIALPVLGIDAVPQTPAGSEKDELEARRPSTRGRINASVSETEANKAARIYIKNRELTAYGVWVRYNPRRVKQKTNPKLLSKNMIGYLMTAIDRRWLPWDSARGRLGISGEFRAGRGRLVIPRRKPAS